jgi:FdhE protein
MTSDYDARIDRAKYLAKQYPFAGEILNFYQQLAGFQKAIYSDLLRSSESPSGTAHDDLRGLALNHSLLMKHFPQILSFLEREAPSPIAEGARRLAVGKLANWAAALNEFWKVGGQRPASAEEIQDESAETVKEFILRAFLQPYVEFLTESMPPPPIDGRPPNCPRCDSAPLLGVLRPEGDGAKRCLICSFCFSEWEFRRIFCAGCGEQDEKKLPVYVADQLPHVRIDACDTCKSYLRTIDLTTNGRAIPIVDDLAAIPLSLWAEERGYTRLEPNLLRT